VSAAFFGRSAAVVSVVTAAAARSACRFALTLLAEREREAGDPGASAFDAPFAARAELAALARSAAPRLEALRDELERLDAGPAAPCVADGSLRCSFAEPAFAASAFAASAFRAARVAAARFAAAERAALFAAASDAVGVADFADGFLAAALRFDAPAFARPGALDVGSPSPACSGTPVPVPSGASSFGSERETEVTQPTYQLDAPDPCPGRSAGPWENCAFPVRRITIALRLLRRPRPGWVTADTLRPA